MIKYIIFGIFCLISIICVAIYSRYLIKKNKNQLDALLKQQQETKQNIDAAAIAKNELEKAQSNLILLQQQSAYVEQELQTKSDLLNKQFTAKEQELQQQYLNLQEEEEARLGQVVSEFMQEWRAANETLEKEQKQLHQQVEQERASYLSAFEASKRAYLKEQERNFYKLNISESDISDIKQLRQIEPLLHHPEALNKAIWKIYYENSTTDLIGRVVGSKIRTGIYKITNINNQMSYIGQAVNIADRWKQHIKRGIGADPVTQNKLYPAMKSEGVENFLFEILEDCDKTKLSEREDYWQDFYKVKEFGYSIK